MPAIKPLVLALLAALALGACAFNRKEEVPPDARACVQPTGRVRASDYNARLTALRQRADVFAKCMEQRGYVLDEDKLEADLLHFEQVKNADVLGGDPQQAIALREQELKASPQYWRKRS